VQHERRVAGHLHTNGHVGNGHAANGQNGNGLSDAATHASHHDHNHEPRPEIIPPAA
jgi:hypothetical protein